VWAAVGIHPNDAMEATPRVLEVIEELAREPVCVAIGETGRDHYRDHTTPAQQDAAFRAQIDIAKRTDRTLVIHCRDAWPEVLATLEEVGSPDRVVMHCFSGDVEVVARCAEAGYYASFAGNVTFRNAGTLRAAAAAVPGDLLLTETDSPYLTPHPHRGEANDPSFVPFTARTLAEAQGVSEAELLERVAANTVRAFALPVGAGPDRG
jgi:TatD DNase family protein